jgi:uncharacterized protein
MIATAQKIAEPSMEEILASIRRIIADDQARARMGPPKAAPVATASTDEGSVTRRIVEPPDAPAKIEEVSAATDGPIVEDLPTASDLSLAVHDTGDLIDDAPRTTEPIRDESASIKKEAPADEARTQNSAQLLSAVVREARRSLTQDRISERGQSQPRPPVDNAAASAPPAAASAPESPVAAAIETAEHAPQLADATSSAPVQQERPDLNASTVAAPPQPPLVPGIATVRTASPYQVATQPSPSPFSLDQSPMLSGEADATIARAFNSLSRTVLSDNARTLEDLVREMLRPLLKAWLDDNLPPVVERLVRVEIERVARGRPG